MGESDVKDAGSESTDQVRESEVTRTGTISAFRSEFYKAYKHQAKIYDKELRAYNEELNVTLLIAVIFSVLASTFLKLDGGKDSLLAWDNPRAASTVTAIVSSSLVASLIVAALVILAKRALKRCAILDFTAANPYRVPSGFRRFVPRIVGLSIEGLSLVLQVALLVVACALAGNLWSQDHRAVSLTVVVIEILCIILITSATIGPALLGVSGGAISKGIRKPLLRALVSMKPNIKRFRQRTLPKRRPSALAPEDGSLEEIAIVSEKDLPITPVFDKQTTDWNGCISDALCVLWMFERPIDSDETMAILDFITEIVWHSGIIEVPLVEVFAIFGECFDYSRENGPTLIPRLRDRAYKAGRAFVHLFVQRKCIGEENDRPLEEIRGMRGFYSSSSYDNDLDSVLNIVDTLFGTPRPVHWTEFKFSEAHQRWLSHILLYRAWDHLCYASKLPDDVEAFVVNAFSSTETHPAVIADCLFIVSLVIGIPCHVDDLAVEDKSSKSEELYKRIFSKLEDTFKGHVVQEYPRSLDGLRLVTPLQNDTIATDSYSLFRVILSSSFEKEEIWAAARFAIHGAYKWDTFLPWVEDPDDIIKFLAHHFALQAKGEDVIAKEPIEWVLRAIAYASNELTLEGLKKFDCTNKLFVNGIRKAFEEDRSFQTRKAVLFLIRMRLIQHRWFDDSLEDVMSDEERAEFCKNWGSAVDGIEHTMDVRKASCGTFYAMLNSEKWRPHIPKGQLRLMEYFTDPSEDPKHFIACKGNTTILPWVRSRMGEEEEDEEKKREWNEKELWKLWLAVLWSDYPNLPKDVKDQVLEMTKDVVSKSRHDVSFISGIMVVERERCKTKLCDYQTSTLDEEAEKLRAKVECLSESIEKFSEVTGWKAK